MSIINRIVKRHKIRQAQPTVIWEPQQLLEVSEAESTGVLPYERWLELFNRLVTDSSLSAEDIEDMLKNFEIEEYTPEAKSLTQPLR